MKASFIKTLVLTLALLQYASPEAAFAQIASKPTLQEAKQIALDAYIFGYPLITMEMTKRVMTNVREPEGTRAPMGQLVRMRAYPDAAFRDVTAPNADTLYTTTWLDVGKEPWILSLPDMHDRYALFPMLDGWTEVFQAPGKRTTGTGPQQYAITGPGWKGKLPKGIKEYKSPTSVVWLLGRIYCTGTPQDYAAVHAIQDAVSVVPLHAYGKPYTPTPGTVDTTIDMKTPVRDQVNALDSAAYFNLLAALMKDNPAAPNDAPMLKKMARLGIVPGKPFDPKKLTPEVQQALAAIPKAGFETIMAHFKSAGTDENGWVFATKTGLYGTDYLQRALITAIGLGANRPQDAVYPTSEADAQGKPYDGSAKYVLHFDKGLLPPVEGFWSLTMYNAEYFFVANPLNRYTLSARNDLTKNADGSVDLYLQNENPGPEKASNWLPTPTGRFIPMLRLYWPKETPPSIIDGTWKIPAIQKVP
ncbi:DUF1254 domain-containing protein [Desulfovibrio aerotolerans]|uniref:DUF1254 domain-containing protein n=1 Tax=Solidesulfovibrio aerotolerans TaxID=295255 RepID=A0A7C9MGZ4_9BACT|nr:DUF1254 domain-containing protein [Solidesulfovibrio aerotolerans]MYL82268.1 DUF1254 domain-containing protein [Solidesulfovibrio aerotolerans]